MGRPRPLSPRALPSPLPRPLRPLRPLLCACVAALLLTAAGAVRVAEGDAVPADEVAASGALSEFVFPGSLAYDALTTLVGWEGWGSGGERGGGRWGKGRKRERERRSRRKKERREEERERGERRKREEEERERVEKRKGKTETVRSV